MEESVILHRLESRLPSQKGQAIDELIGIVRDSGKLHFNNKLSLFSSFKRILHDDDLILRTKCTKLINDILPKLGPDMDTCMSFVMSNLLTNMAAGNLVLKRESIKLVRGFSEITGDRNGLIRSVIWEGIDNKDPAVAKEVIVNLDKLIHTILQTEDCYNTVTALCKRYYLEDNRKVKKAIRESFSSLVKVVGAPKMEELITQLPNAALSSGRELLQTYKQTEKPKAVSYKSNSKLEVDSAISLEGKLLWDLIPDATLTKLHGDDIIEQLKAIAELESAIRRVKKPADFLVCVDEICEAIIKVIPISNFRVFKASTVLVSAFVEVFREVLGECVYPLSRALCHKIGDNKIAVREGTMKCLTLLMKVCGPKPVLDVVLVSLRDRNPRVREEAINVIIKTLLTFPLEELDTGNIADSLACALGDHRQRVVNTALEALTVLKERMPARDASLVYSAVEKVDQSDGRYLSAIKERCDKGNLSTLNDAGLITHGEGCFSRNGTIIAGSPRISHPSVSAPNATDHMTTREGTLCPPTPLALPRRYYSAGRNRLPWEKPCRQSTGFFSNTGAEEGSYPATGPVRGGSDRSHVFIKGGGARTDGGSYAQMHLRKMQQIDGEDQNGVKGDGSRSNTLGSLKKYFPSVKGSPDPKRSWPSVSKRDDENSSPHPVKSNSFANDTGYAAHTTAHVTANTTTETQGRRAGDTGYGVQSSSMYANYRINSGESSGMGSLTNNTPNGSACNPPRPTHYSPSSALNDSGIFEEHSFVNSKKSTPRFSTKNPQSTRSRTHSLNTDTTKTPVKGILKKSRDPSMITRDGLSSSKDWDVAFGREKSLAQTRGARRKIVKKQNRGSEKSLGKVSSHDSIVPSTRRTSNKTSSRKPFKYYPKSPTPIPLEPSIHRCPLTPEDLAMVTTTTAAKPRGNKKKGSLVRLPPIDVSRVSGISEENDRNNVASRESVTSRENVGNQTYRVIPMVEIERMATQRSMEAVCLPEIESHQRSTPVTEEHRTTPQAPEPTTGVYARKESPGRREAGLDDSQEDEEERLEAAKWENIRREELAEEEKRRSALREQIARENDAAEQRNADDHGRMDRYRIGNGYAELTSQNLAKKKLKQAAEDSRKARPKLVKARTRNESICNDTDHTIDIVGRGLSSNHIDSVPKEPVKDKPKASEDRTPLRAPSGVYGQRVSRVRAPEQVEGILSDDGSDTDEEDEEEEGMTRDGHPAGSGLSAATRMRFEKKRAQYVERQSAEKCREEHSPNKGYERKREESRPVKTEREETGRAAYGKPVSAPVENRVPNTTNGVKRSPSKTHVRAQSHRPGGDVDVDGNSQSSSLVDDKADVPLMNPETAIQEALKNLKMGSEEWNYKVQGLHVLRRAARHHPELFQNDLLNYIRVTCGEIPNLRSQVSRLAIQIIGDYFCWLKTAMDTDLDRTCDTLLQKYCDMNQFIRTDIVLSLQRMAEFATPGRVLTSLINTGTNHKNGTVRSIAAACFKDAVQRVGISRCLTSTKDMVCKFLTALDKLSHDGNQETRYYGRLVLSWCMEHPNFDQLCQKHLPAASARNVRDVCDKLATKGVGTLPQSNDRTSGRYRSQPVSRAQSNLSATYPNNRSRKPSRAENLNATMPSESVTSSPRATCEAHVTSSPRATCEAHVEPSPRVTRRAGPRRDIRDGREDRMPQSLYKQLNSNNWQERYSGLAELLELCVKQPDDVKHCIVRISDAFVPRLKDPNSKVNLYALQCLLRMLPHLESSIDQVLTPLTEQLVPNLASQRANIVTLTSQILDGFKVHLDNPQLVCEYCRILKSQSNPRIKPIILDKISDLIRDVYEQRPKLVEQMTLPILVDHHECLQKSSGVNSLGSYVGRLASLLYQCMGSKLLSEVNRMKPATVPTIREYLVANS